jgi:hypothetical protein
MSDIAPLSQRNVPEGYTSRTIQVEGQDMTFTFYMGFASAVTYTPRGGATIPVYTQDGTFHVPGGVGPSADCKMWIVGGPDDLDVELEIDDSPRPAPSYRGPIESFQVVTNRHGGGGGTSPRVKAKRGGDKVHSINVQVRGEGGGVFPHMPESGGTTDVTNHAATCPPVC